MSTIIICCLAGMFGVSAAINLYLCDEKAAKSVRKDLHICTAALVEIADLPPDVELAALRQTLMAQEALNKLSQAIQRGNQS